MGIVHQLASGSESKANVAWHPPFRYFHLPVVPAMMSVCAWTTRIMLASEKAQPCESKNGNEWSRLVELVGSGSSSLGSSFHPGFAIIATAIVMNNVTKEQGGGTAPSGAAPALSKAQNASNSSITSSGTSTPENTPEVDFVLVFESIPKKYLKPGKVPPAEKSAIAREYQKLIDAVSDVGLQVTSREGKVGSGQVLIFVRAQDDALVKIGREEK